MLTGIKMEKYHKALSLFKTPLCFQEHFRNECLQVFTVSSLEFQKGEQSLLQPDETG